MNRLLAFGFLLAGLLGFSGAASADCSNSPAGSYCQSGQCPAGSYSAAGAAVCTPCAPGTFSSSPGSASCTAVTSSYYLFGGSVATGTGFTGQAACPISTPGFRTYGANPVALGNYYGSNYPIAPNDMPRDFLAIYSWGPAAGSRCRELSAQQDIPSAVLLPSVIDICHRYSTA